MPEMRLNNGLNLHYEDDDFSDPWKPAQVALLQHGFGRSSQFWYSWVPTLGRHCRVIRPDFRGFGQSDRPRDPAQAIRVEHFITDLIELLDRLDVEKVHYCGESLGGMVGAVLAAQHPERVATLTMVSSPIRIHGKIQQTFAVGYPSWLEALEKLGVEGWARLANAARFPADVDPGLPEWYATEMGKTDLECLKALVRHVPSVDITPYLAQVQAPTLLLYPEAGHLADDSALQVFRQHLRDLTVVTMPTTLHTVANIFPERCAAEMLRLIQESP